MIPLHALSALGKFAAIAALKAKFISQMAPLKAHLVATVGPQVANISMSTLASAAAAAFYAQKVQGKGSLEQEEAAIKAARETGFNETAKEISRWVRDNF